MPVTNIPTLLSLFPNNTQVINFFGLQDIVTGLYLNQATVTASLRTARGDLDPVFQDIPLEFVSGSNGNYQGTIPFEFNAAIGDGYTVEITAEQAGVQSFYSLNAEVVLRDVQ